MKTHDDPPTKIAELPLTAFELPKWLVEPAVRSCRLFNLWDIGEAAGPMIAGFLIGGLGYAATFDVLATVIAVVTVGLMALVRDPKAAAADRESERPVK
jgi:hypothetical protein